MVKKARKLRWTKITYEKKIIIFLSYYLRIRESCIENKIAMFASWQFSYKLF